MAWPRAAPGRPRRTRRPAGVAGAAAGGGFGSAAAKPLAEAGAKNPAPGGPPALGISKPMPKPANLDASLPRRGGRKLERGKFYPLDADFDRREDVPAE